MKLGRSEKINFMASFDEKATIDRAAYLCGESTSAYARRVLIKDAENTIKKASKK